MNNRNPSPGFYNMSSNYESPGDYRNRMNSLADPTSTDANPKDLEGNKKPPLSLDPHKSKAGKKKLCSAALHPLLSYPLVDVAEMSLEKGYKPFNWLEKGKDSTRVLYWVEAAQRHIDKIKLGIDLNKEERKLDGTSVETTTLHAACAAYDLLCLLLLQNSEVVVDDRIFKDGKLK